MAGLYLHIPFCRRKCSYCDFYSFEGTADELTRYSELLIQHLTWVARQGYPEQIETIYFGGGTPSLLQPSAVGRILDEIHCLYNVADSAEISLEVNPGTVTLETLRDFRKAGVNRLSLGLQSCNNKQLAQLGRLHSHEDGINVVRWARQSGFTNISLDLMFALPKQTQTELENELKTYLSLEPEHLSCYGLTAEPGTPLHKRVVTGETTLPEDNDYAEAFMLIHNQLNSAGFEHYEIANYARQGFRCQHNETYWQRRPYLGVGAGAHSYIDNGWGSRWRVPDDLTAWTNALAEETQPADCLETFDSTSALKETIYLALRTRQGVADEILLQNFNCTMAAAFPAAIDSCANWLFHESGHWKFTPEGWLIFDSLILHFL